MDVQASIPVTMCLSKVTLAAGTTTTISTTGTTVYGVKGKAFSKAAITNGATPTVDWTTGNPFLPISANQGTIIVVGLDSTGAIRAVQGSINALDVNGNFVNAPQFGGLGPAGSVTNDNDFCPIGYIVAKGGSALVGTWTFGTNNLSGVTGMAYTFVDVIGLPDRPQVS